MPLLGYGKQVASLQISNYLQESPTPRQKPLGNQVLLIQLLLETFIWAFKVKWEKKRLLMIPGIARNLLYSLLLNWSQSIVKPLVFLFPQFYLKGCPRMSLLWLSEVWKLERSSVFLGSTLKSTLPFSWKTSSSLPPAFPRLHCEFPEPLPSYPWFTKAKPAKLI